MSPSTESSNLKWMRKGTHSCQECRRRKIKCTYPAGQSAVCNECAENSRVCRSQGIVAQSKNITGKDNSNGLKVRIARLESVVERLSKLPPDQAAEMVSDASSYIHLQLPTSTSNTKEMAEALERQLRAIPPVLALFNNEIMRTDEDLDLALLPNLSYRINFGPGQLSDIEKLLSIISKETEIMGALDIAPSWWLPWQAYHPDLKDKAGIKSLQVFVTESLADSRPVVVGTGLLCIATSLQNMRPGIDDINLHLSVSIPDLMNRIAATIDQVVLDNDDHISCFDGIWLLAMRGKLHAESNQLRKAWLCIRRSILLAEKIGLIRSYSEKTDARSSHSQRFLDNMIETDRFLSMFLGMPYALIPNFDNAKVYGVMSNSPDTDKRMRTLRRVAAIAAGKVNDRNSCQGEVAWKMTEEIQDSLHTAKESMPVEWWDIRTHVTYITNPLITHEHLYAQLWFYQTQSFLHLPYMLKATSDPASGHNRELCLNASRQLLKLWITLCQNTILSTYTCRLDDFQGLIGAIIVLVGLLQSFSQNLKPWGSIDEDDIKLIATVKGTLRHAAQKQGGSIAKQGLHTIETLSSFLEPDIVDSLPSPRKITLFVPYFGAITVESGFLYNPKQNNLRLQGREQPHRLSLTDPSHNYEETLDAFYPEANPAIQEPHAFENSQSEYMDISTYLDFGGGNSSAIEEHQPPSPTIDDAQFGFGGFDRLPDGMLVDWEKLMMGTELNQDWNDAFVDSV